jgi:hypothetical protein
LSTLDKLFDEKKGAASKAVNLLTGARLTDVDYNRAREVAARAMLQERLKGSPNFREFSKLYIDPSRRQNLTPEEYVLMQLYTQLEKEAQAEAKARKAAQLPVGLPRR